MSMTPTDWIGAGTIATLAGVVVKLSLFNGKNGKFITKDSCKTKHEATEGAVNQRIDDLKEHINIRFSDLKEFLERNGR